MLKHTRSYAVADDNGEKLISANIVLLQFAFAIYFIYSSASALVHETSGIYSLPQWHQIVGCLHTVRCTFYNAEMMNYVFVYMHSSLAHKQLHIYCLMLSFTEFEIRFDYFRMFHVTKMLIHKRYTQHNFVCMRVWMTNENTHFLTKKINNRNNSFMQVIISYVNLFSHS